MMNSDAVLSLFRQCGALLEGHFRLSSGLHSQGYLQSALVLQHPTHAASLGGALAARVADLRPTIVLSPALGGVVIGHEVARGLGVRAIFAERQDGALTLRRGFSVSEAEQILIVEDVITTGRSTKETLEVARKAGADVVGIGALVDRGEAAKTFDVPVHVLVAVSWPTYDPDDCPLCAAGATLSKPGSRPDRSTA